MELTVTVVKLAHGLVHQFVYLRNHDASKTSIDGFYFPLNKAECVLRVTANYDESSFQFKITIAVMSCLSAAALLPRLYRLL